MMKRTLSLVLVLALVFSMVPAALAAESQKELTTAIDRAVGYYRTAGLTSWEEVAALKGAGADLSGWTLPAYAREDVKYGAATMAGYVLGCLSAGQNPRTYFEDMDLVLDLSRSQQADGSFGGGYMSHTAYAVLALEAVSGRLYRRDAAKAYLIQAQDASGAYGYADWQTGAFVSDPDTTAMALQALACFSGDEAVDASIDKAVAYLKSARDGTGAYLNYEGKPNCNTAAVVLSGLVAVGEDLTEWSGTIASLLSFQHEDGSFGYTADETAPNGLATRQALLALGDLSAGKTAYQRLKAQDPGIELLYADGGLVNSTLKDYVAQAHEKGLLIGTTAQTFQPKKYLAWWEFETVMSRIGLTVTGENRERAVTREEVALGIYKALDLPEGDTLPADVDQAANDPELRAALSAVMKAEIMIGTGSGNFRPKGYLTREQLAKIVVLASQYGA